jgi:hypothetical protein
MESRNAKCTVTILTGVVRNKEIDVCLTLLLVSNAFSHVQATSPLDGRAVKCTGKAVVVICFEEKSQCRHSSNLASLVHS